MYGYAGIRACIVFEWFASVYLQDLSFKAGMRPSLRPASRTKATVRAARVSCSAQKQEAPIASTAAALALAAGLALSAAPAHADIAGLTLCSESKEYAKVQKKEIKGLQKRLKLVRHSTHGLCYTPSWLNCDVTAV